MSVSKRRNGSLLALLALAGTAIFLLPTAEAGAATFQNACVNSLIPTQSSSIPVTLTGKTSTAGPVKAGDSITLEEIKEELAIPPAVFIAGYNAGVLTTGLNKIPTEVNTVIRGTNTVQESQVTNTVATEAETTITDPDEEPGTGDEVATPGAVKVSYANQTWTAGTSGPIEFREKTVFTPPLPPGFTNLSAGINIKSVVAGALTVRFGCDPGEVVESAEPKTIKLKTFSPAFATLANENAANRASHRKRRPRPAGENRAAALDRETERIRIVGLQRGIVCAQIQMDADRGAGPDADRGHHCRADISGTDPNLRR